MCPDTCAWTHRYPRKLTRIILGPWPAVIGKRCVWPNKHSVSNPRSVPEKDSALYCHVIAYYDITFNKSMGTDIAAASNFRSTEDHSILPNSRTLANGYAACDIRERMYFRR